MSHQAFALSGAGATSSLFVVVAAALAALCMASCAPNHTEEEWARIQTVYVEGSAREAFEKALAGAINRGCIIRSADGAGLRFDAELTHSVADGSFSNWQGVAVHAQPAGAGAAVRLKLRAGVVGYHEDGPCIDDPRQIQRAWDRLVAAAAAPSNKLRRRIVHATPDRVAREAVAAMRELGWCTTSQGESAGVASGHAPAGKEWWDMRTPSRASIVAVPKGPGTSEVTMLFEFRRAEQEDALWRALALRLDDAIR